MTEAKPETENTNQFKKLQEFLKRNIAQIALLINAVGFVILFYYYKFYWIPIFNYLGINDLIFFVSDYVLTIALIVFIFEFPIFLLYFVIRTLIEKHIISRKEKQEESSNDGKEVKSRANEVFTNSFMKGLRRVNQWILPLLSIAALFLPFKQYIMGSLIVCIVYFFLIPVMKGEGNKTALGVGIFLACLMFYYIGNDSHNKKRIKQDYTISFVENGQLITTEKGVSTLNYLGESSKAIFLYDIESKEARIFNKSNISDIKIQNIPLSVIITNHIRN